MGVALREIIKAREITFEELNNKILAVDAYNQLYQYLTTIRGADGSPLKDSKGSITSHLVGLFSRTANLIQKNIKLAFVFDGIPPKLKHMEIEKRTELKKEALALYEKAVEEKDVEAMKKYAGRTAKLTPEMVDESKYLLALLGIPVIQAPSEADAQIAFMVKKNDAFACVSQDFDALLHGAPIIIRNLSIAGRKKKANTLSYETIKPEKIVLQENLELLKITQDQLIAVGILTGTDYNPGGVKGIGPKKALKIVKEHKGLDKIFAVAKWEENSEIGWKEIFDVIKKMPVTKDYSLEWKTAKKEKIVEMLCGSHDFSKERVNKTLGEIERVQKTQGQKGLGGFFK